MTKEEVEELEKRKTTVYFRDEDQKLEFKILLLNMGETTTSWFQQAVDNQIKKSKGKQWTRYFYA